ncbi:MAG: ethanolamine ammonia-lyase subunit EutB [Candidatus Riflebacteria bacterium]|nr:ethanolamine ammonia-lyase subunit EutB [Candidatus Riflebacteria bacterium]
MACLGIFLGISSVWAVAIDLPRNGEDVLQYVQRTKGNFDQTLYRQVIGAGNYFKEGDETVGVAAQDDASRIHAWMLLTNTKINVIHEHPMLEDKVQKFIWETTDTAAYEKIKNWTLGELEQFLLTKTETEIREIMPGLDSDVIGCVVKLMNNSELTVVGQKIFNPLPGSKIGAKGYMGARLQPNSPTDNPEDIVWQVFDGWCYGTGDVVLGTNPVSGSIDDLKNIEEALKDIIVTFGLQDVIPWCVLSHIDKQNEVEKKYPGSTALWFQSLASCDDANQTFDVTVEKMRNYASMRVGSFGMYFETGQGADFTNGAGHGFDMVIHESRKYGFSRALKKDIAKVAPQGRMWQHTNDVAGFIGPEVFKCREQLVRCCLEDIVMGKLHGLCLGLDICSTLHMPISLEDLDWCMDQIMPANPAYLMGLPTKNDPMLSYLTTAFQDHVRLREKFGYKVNDAMQDFFKRIQIVDQQNRYTEHFGDPVWVYYQYRLAKGDKRSREEIYAEGEAIIKRVEARGCFIARGHGKKLWDLQPELAAKVQKLYDDAKMCIWTEFTPEFLKTLPNSVFISTNSKDREDYVAHPESGEKLNSEATAAVEKLRDSWGDKIPDVQIVISDGLNGRAIMDEGHLAPYLKTIREELSKSGLTASEKYIVVKSGRVRAGYEIGSILFGKSDPEKPRIIVHVIGERPGTEHRNYSVYLTGPKAGVWAKKTVDHDISMVISGISDTAYSPVDAAKETLSMIMSMMKMGKKM